MQSIPSGDGANKSAIKGKISNTLLTQVLIFSLAHVKPMQEILKELNEELQ